MYWCSIVLEALPYILVGVFATALLQRLRKHVKRSLAPLCALLLPGCDCSLNGFASALGDMPPPLAGFVLTWSACCAPAALIATHAALGAKMTAVRLIAGLIAASGTGLTWKLWAQRGWAGCKSRRASMPRQCDALPARPHAGDIAQAMHRALGGLAAAACGATLWLLLSPARAHAALPGQAALAGALLSPCSVADALLARALFSSAASQASFIVAAQCMDLRQLLLLQARFGLVPALLALGSAAAACLISVKLA